MAVALAGAGDPAALLWEAQKSRWRARPPIAAGQGILLAGSSGAGKSTLAMALAERLGLPAIDLDDRIESRTGKAIHEIFAQEGEAEFRELEARHLVDCLRQPAVVALGGGAWETGAVREAAAASGFGLLWLAESPARCWSRAGGDPDRPLAASRAEFLARHRRRILRWSTLPCALPLGRPPEVLAEALSAAID